jgi:hypothetical protein
MNTYMLFAFAGVLVGLAGSLPGAAVLGPVGLLLTLGAICTGEYCYGLADGNDA